MDCLFRLTKLYCFNSQLQMYQFVKVPLDVYSFNVNSWTVYVAAQSTVHTRTHTHATARLRAVIHTCCTALYCPLQHMQCCTLQACSTAAPCSTLQHQLCSKRSCCGSSYTTYFIILFYRLMYSQLLRDV